VLFGLSVCETQPNFATSEVWGFMESWTTSDNIK
jgi:hypothetical protein